VWTFLYLSCIHITLYFIKVLNVPKVPQMYATVLFYFTYLQILRKNTYYEVWSSNPKSLVWYDWSNQVVWPNSTHLSTLCLLQFGYKMSTCTVHRMIDGYLKVAFKGKEKVQNTIYNICQKIFFSLLGQILEYRYCLVQERKYIDIKTSNLVLWEL